MTDRVGIDTANLIANATIDLVVKVAAVIYPGLAAHTSSSPLLSQEDHSYLH